jgi:hypothetical protein
MNLPLRRKGQKMKKNVIKLSICMFSVLLLVYWVGVNPANSWSDSDIDANGLPDGEATTEAVVYVDCYAGSSGQNYGAIEGVVYVGYTDTYYFYIHDGIYSAEHLQFHITDGWNPNDTITANVTYKGKVYTFNAKSPKAINVDGPVSDGDVVRLDISNSVSGAYWIFWGLHNGSY